MKAKLIVLDPSGAYIPGKGGRPQGDYFEMESELAQAYASGDPTRFKVEPIAVKPSGNASSRVEKKEEAK